MNTIENRKAPEPIQQTIHRKPRVSRHGAVNGLTRLKEVVLTDPTLRDTLYDLTETLTCEQWIQCVNEDLKVGLGGHRSAVTRFRKYVESLHAIEDQESRREFIIQHYREQYPNETEDQLTQRAILFFKQEAFAIGDLAGFIKIGRLSLAVRSHQRKAKLQETQR